MFHISILQNTLIRDIKKLGLPTDFHLDIRGYSKAYNGRYEPIDSKVIVYAREKDGKLRDYQMLLEIVIHEVIHHYQWKHQKGYKRLKGIMHDKKFHEMNNYYQMRGREMREELRNVTKNFESVACNN